MKENVNKGCYFFPEKGARAYSSAYFGQGVGDIHMTYVRCIGTESRLLSCSYSTTSRYSCSHYEDAGVRCPGMMPSPCLTTRCCIHSWQSLLLPFDVHIGTLDLCHSNSASVLMIPKQMLHQNLKNLPCTHPSTIPVLTEW